MLRRDARTISEQFGVKLDRVQCILELFQVRSSHPSNAQVPKADGCPSQVAPTFEQLYDQGRYSVSPHWQRRELAQANLDWEEVSLHGEENVTRITSVSELQLAQAARRRRRNVQLTEASQVRMPAYQALALTFDVCWPPA